MANTVAQSSVNPTNKVSAATIATALVGLSQAIVNKFWPEFSDPNIWAAVYPLSALIAGWVVPDKPNVELPDV